MLLSELVNTSNKVRDAGGRLEKVALLADFLGRLEPNEAAIGTAFLCGTPRQSKLGLGYAALSALSALPALPAPPAPPALNLEEVDAAFEQVAGTSGKGSAGEKSRILNNLWENATAPERQFLVRLIMGELRQGALEGIVLEAVARAAQVPTDELRRAFMTAGDLPTVAAAALAEGVAGLSRFAVRLFRPILPMLAETASGVGDALARLGRAALEYKIDGARIQVHKGGSEVQVYSRRLNPVTDAVPELVEIVRALGPRELILDGEAIALRADGSPHPFQITMRRFGRRLEVERVRQELPLTPFFFDLLYLDGQTLLDQPQERRFAALREALPHALVIPHTIAATTAEAQAFLDQALARGHEGIMAKALDAPYEAGHRGQRWLKVKLAQTLDLVVLAAEWGHGRRRGWLSNLHLGARDPDSGDFVMLGKTFKGMTDEMLAWQTERLQQLETSRDAHTVYVRPELVVEVAFDGVQTSPQYPGGVALRFTRIKGYRPDKSPAEADTIETVRGMRRG
jgi:DNA ligase-1